MLIPPAQFRRRLLAWFDASRRDLPWRRPLNDPSANLDPYAVLVSEAMLQQTQVATVIPYFNRWMKAFPTLASLAAAPEHDVLRLWQGLGYYNRARNLHRAAKHITTTLAGNFPTTPETLLDLPGVGPYSAGAIASIAFNQPAPLVDGNVQRVLSRLYAYPHDPRSRTGAAWTWSTAAALVPTSRPGDFNSALMELGATLCTPKNPQCLLCPVAQACAARDQNLQTQIPPPKPAKPSPHLSRIVFCLRRPDNTYLLEQRPPTGRWASLWQFPSREEYPTPTDLPHPPHPILTPLPPLPNHTAPLHLDPVPHTLTHRRYTFHPRLINVPQSYCLPEYPPTSDLPPRPTAWTPLSSLSAYPLPKPHLTIATHLRSLPPAPPTPEHAVSTPPPTRHPPTSIPTPLSLCASPILPL